MLIVDDDPLSSAFQSHLVSLLGYHAQTESSGERALALALGGGFDVLLLDLGMPAPDGFEVLRLLREAEAARGRPPLVVIAVTGYASEADRQRCLLAGFNEHLAKPIQAQSLAATIQRTLGAAPRAPSGSDAARLRDTVKRLNSMRPGDRSFAPTVTESFALRSAQLLETLRRCVQQRESEPLARAAQALKASAEFLGASRLAGMAGELDAQAARGDWQAAEAALAAMNNEHQAVLTLLFESAR